MLKNYLKVAWRSLIRNFSFSIINILGLAIGMASAILILLWVQNEMSHDRFHAKKDRLYRLNNRDSFNGEVWAWPTTPKAMVPALKQEYPDVEDAVRVNDARFLFTVGDKHINLDGVFTDPGFLTTFSFPLVQGLTNALNGNYNIVLTRKGAEKLFGDEDAMGKVVRLDSTDNFTVAGVLADLPNNTVFEFDYLLPWSYMKKLGWDDTAWGNNSIQSFVVLKPGVKQAEFDKKIDQITIKHRNSANDNGGSTHVFTQLFSDTWLYSKAENGKYVGGRISMVSLFTVIAGIILLIACINFMNLSTARSEKRAKEVGIRKAVGAPKRLLVMQFIGESIMLAFFAGIIAIVLVELSLPAFNNLVSKNIYIPFADPFYWLVATCFIIFTGLLAGSYPAFYLSAFKPVKVLKGTFKAANAQITPRKILVIVQFTFAIALVICTVVVLKQIKHAQARDAGYVKDNLIYVPLQGEINKHYDLIKSELLRKGVAVAVTKSMSRITSRNSDGWGFSWSGSTENDKKMDFVRMASDADFVKAMGVNLIQGRDIDIKAYPADSTALLLNETAVKAMRLQNPLGQIIKGDGRDWHVVGVIKDFIYASPYEKVDQLMVFGPQAWFNGMHIKLNNQRPVAKNLAMAEQIFKESNPQYPFDYKFMDEDYARKFKNEKRIGSLAGLFAGLTIFISCLGLFGLSTYMAENRIKEIGVRKVLGASVLNITALLSRDFLKLVVISIVIASPIAWWMMNSWLQGYAYKISISVWVFVMAGLAAMSIALLTISFQSVKAAMANPIKNLRSE